MTKIEICKLFENRGFKYNPETGDITGISGKTITRKQRGYILLGIKLNGKQIKLTGHHFAWWMVYREIVIESDKIVIDHIDRIKTNNRISNLRKVSHLENNTNTDRWEYAKGYCCHTGNEIFVAYIRVKRKKIHLGCFDTEKEAREAYLAALAYYYPNRYKSLKEKGLI